MAAWILPSIAVSVAIIVCCEGVKKTQVRVVDHDYEGDHHVDWIVGLRIERKSGHHTGYIFCTGSLTREGTILAYKKCLKDPLDEQAPVVGVAVTSAGVTFPIDPNSVQDIGRHLALAALTGYEPPQNTPTVIMATGNREFPKDASLASRDAHYTLSPVRVRFQRNRPAKDQEFFYDDENAEQAALPGSPLFTYDPAANSYVLHGIYTGHFQGDGNAGKYVNLHHHGRAITDAIFHVE